MTREVFHKRYRYNNRADKIGGGSFGTVYKAYDRTLDRDVAIKVQEVKYIEKKEFSLQIEYDAIKALSDHPNIANYESVHRFEDGPGIFDYAIMQYYSLGNLSSYIKANTVTHWQKSKILVQILQGIGYLHFNKVVHRDIKPGNILVVERPGEGIVPKITDFGLSKLAVIQDGDTHFQNSFAGGTVQYSSPEQLKGLPLKFNTDLWSFGAIIYEVFTSKPLFDVEGYSTASVEWQSEVMKQILHENLDAKLKELPKEWGEIAKTCLERDNSIRAVNGKELLRKIPKEFYVLEEDYFLKKKTVPKSKNPVEGLKSQTSKGTVVLPTIDEKESLDNRYPEQEDDIGTILVGEKKHLEQDTVVAAVKKPAKKRGILIGVVVFVVIAMALIGYFFLGSSAPPEFLAKVQKGEKYGYIDTHGNETIGLIYENGFSFGEGLAPIKQGDKWGYINTDGDLVIACKYVVATPFTDGIAAVKQTTGWSYIDKKGKKVIADVFLQTGGFGEGLAAVNNGEGWGYIDKTGKVVIEYQFDNTRPFSDGLAAVNKDGLWGFIDRNASLVIPFQYKDVKDFSQNVAAVLIDTDTWKFVDRNNNEVVPGSFRNAKEFSEGLVAVEKGNAWGFIDKEGKEVIPFDYSGAGYFTNGLVAVRKGDKWGFVDKNGKTVVDYKYDYADNFNAVGE